MRSLLIGAILTSQLLSAQGIEALCASVRERAERIASSETDTEREVQGDSLKLEMKRLLNHRDALKTKLDIPITKVSSPDGKIKLFSWNISYLDGSHRYHALMLSKGRKHNVLTEFRDSTSVIEDVDSKEHYPGKWYGALYYDLVQVKRGGKTYYTLLGWKGYSSTETQKVIEVIHLSGRRVRLGAPLFEDSPHERKRLFRKVYKYAYAARMELRSSTTDPTIYMDHLSPSRPDLKGQYAFYGPDLSYDSYSWDGRNWFLEKGIDLKGNDRESKLWNKPEKPRVRP